MPAMTDFDTASAVVWPKWCYTTAQSEKDHDIGLNNNSIPLKEKDSFCPRNARKPRKEPGAAAFRKEAFDRGHHGMTTETSGEVKSERLSPEGGAEALTPNTTVSQTSLSPSSSPKSPINHRTRTPSFPSTPPHPAFTPPNAALHQAFDRFSPGALAGMGGLPGGPGAIKQMESLMTRNCSDLMRSLAAKYNNSNPNDFFSTHTNGFLRNHLGPVGGFKGSGSLLGVGTAPPVVSLPTSRDVEKKNESGVVTTVAGVPPSIAPPGAPTLFPGAHLPGFPGFPLVDMSSTQVLLNMVRNASAAQQSQLENYLRGAAKRPAENPTSPLDLSSSVGAKRPRTETPKGFDVKNLFSVAPEEERKFEGKGSSPPPRVRPLSSPGCNKQGIVCGDRNCPNLEAVSHWTVEDVCSFVGSIDLCSEYVEAFREHKIDGTALPLLTEEHLTTSIQMKLGPALKLKSVLARKLGSCSVCLHCDHCHSSSTERRPSSASSGQ